MRSPLLRTSAACGLVGVLSTTGWLTPALVAQVEGGSESTRAERERDAAAPPAEDAAIELARRLDEAFAKGDRAGYLAHFHALHTVLHALLTRRLTDVFAAHADLDRHSEIKGYWRLGRHAIVHVASTTTDTERPDAGAVREDALWALRNASSEPVVVLSVEIDPNTLDAMQDPDDPLRPKHQLRCYACNYSIHAGEDWLMVPNCGARTGCLESFSFYSLEHDLSASLTIHLDAGHAALKPQAVLLELVERNVDVPVDGVRVESWLPPSYDDQNRPRHLEGARCVLVDVPYPGWRTEAHLATYGRLAYLFVVRGRVEAVEAEREAVRRLMESFVLDDPSLDPEEVALRITKERQGGWLEGQVYTNERYGVRFTGPPEWTGRTAAGQYAFDVTWRRPDGHAFVRLKALAVPVGAVGWTKEMVESVARNACAGEHLTLRSPAGWIEGNSGFAHERHLTGTDARGRAVVLRLSFDEDLFAIVEARGPAADVAELQHAAGRLTRER